MTTTAERSLPAITCVSSLIASCPPLLGFEPGECLICVMQTSGAPGTFLARVDLVDDADAAIFGQALAATILRSGAQRVQLVLWLDVEDDAQRSALPGQRLVEQLDACLEASGQIDVQVSVATNGRTWWGLLCQSSDCCGEVGLPVDAEVAQDVRLNYLLAGYGTLPSRDDLHRRLERDSGRAQETVEELTSLPRRAETLVSRRRAVDGLWRVLSPGQARTRAIGPDCADRHLDRRPEVESPWRGAGGRRTRIPSRAEAIRDLRDPGIRDALLIRLALDPTRCRSCWDRTAEALLELLRAAPTGQGAPAATLVALVSWLSGDGALATIACQLARDEDPGYRLAGLTLSLMGSGLSPDEWRASCTGLTEEQCLAGTALGPGEFRA